MSNIINLTWDGATDDNGISGYQLQWRTNPTSPWSSIIYVPHNPNSPNTAISGGGSYSHTITQLADHYFRIRIVDSVGQFSGYKQILAPVDSNLILISHVSTTTSNLACSAHPLVPIDPIILRDSTDALTTTIINFLTFVKKSDNTVFDGQTKCWRILLSGISYSCKIEPSGRIIESVLCSSLLSNVKTESISFGYTSNTTSSAICSADLLDSIYFYNTLVIGTIIYTFLNDDGVTLSIPLIGGNKYYVMTYNFSTYVVKISSNPPGKVLSVEDYNIVCPTNNLIETCCFVKGTKITMSDYTTKNIEDVKIGDFVITYNEKTGKQEPGEVSGVASPMRSDIVEYELSNNVIIKSTTCHPYWVIDKGWSSFDPELTKRLYDFSVEQIKENDILLSIDNDEIIIYNITELITKEIITYNLSVIGNHTYYANNILVHNKLAEPEKFEADGETLTTAWINWNSSLSSQTACIAP